MGTKKTRNFNAEYTEGRGGIIFVFLRVLRVLRVKKICLGCGQSLLQVLRGEKTVFRFQHSAFSFQLSAVCFRLLMIFLLLPLPLFAQDTQVRDENTIPGSTAPVDAGTAEPELPENATGNPVQPISPELQSLIEQGRGATEDVLRMLANQALERYGKKRHNEERTKKVIQDRHQNVIPNLYKDVEQNINKWMPDRAWDSAKKLARDELWDNFQGAPLGEMVKRYVEDSIDLIAQFHVVNTNPIHTFPQMIIPPITIPWPCGIHFQYPGFEAGTCYWLHPSPNPFCGFIFYETASLVEYHYPAYKVDTSEQIFQTAYLPNELLRIIADILNQLVASWAPSATIQAAMYSYGMVRKELQGMGVDLPYAPPRFDSATVKFVSDQFKLTIEAVKDANRGEILGAAPAGEKGEMRNVFEPLNLLSLAFPHIPHVAKYHLWASDLPLALYGVPGGYFFGRIIMLSLTAGTTEAWLRKISKFLISFIPGKPLITGLKRCIANNKTKPRDLSKTPWDIDISVNSVMDFLDSPPSAEIEKWGRELGIDVCIDLIGEVFPFTNSRRLHITDGAYQTAWKYLNLFHYMLPLELLSLDPQQFLENLLQNLIQAGIGQLPQEAQQILGYMNQAQQALNNFQSMPFDQALFQTGSSVAANFGIDIPGNLRPIANTINIVNQLASGFQNGSIENILLQVNQVGSTMFGLNISAWISPRHSFLRKLDAWFVLGNHYLRIDQESNGKQGKPIDLMTMLNVELNGVSLKYQNANIKIPKSGSENTFEIFPRFKGCWNPLRKGFTPQFMIEAPRPPVPIPPIPWPLWYPSQMPGQLRLY